jgi:hypothetical protein
MYPHRSVFAMTGKNTRRGKSYCAHEAILRQLEDIED